MLQHSDAMVYDTATAALSFIRPAVEDSKRRRAFCAPEVTEYPDEIFFEWADNLLETMGRVTQDLIEAATGPDMQALLCFFTEEGTAWPAHRRIFFTVLHIRAQELETSGRGVASRAFVDFYRDRYRPNYTYILERVDLTPIEVIVHPPTSSSLMTPLSPILESSEEMCGAEGSEEE